MRHVSRTHRVFLNWLFDRINLDPKIQIKHIDTKNQLADMESYVVFVQHYQCKPCLPPGGSSVLSDPNQIDAEFRKAWLPYFFRSGQRETSLDEFGFEVDG